MELMFPRIVPIPPKIELIAVDWAGLNAPALMSACTVFIKLRVAESVFVSIEVVVGSKTSAACAVFVFTDKAKTNAKSTPADTKQTRNALIFLVIVLLIVNYLFMAKIVDLAILPRTQTQKIYSFISAQATYTPISSEDLCTLMASGN